MCSLKCSGSCCCCCHCFFFAARRHAVGVSQSVATALDGFHVYDMRRENYLFARTESSDLAFQASISVFAILAAFPGDCNPSSHFYRVHWWVRWALFPSCRLVLKLIHCACVCIVAESLSRFFLGLPSLSSPLEWPVLLFCWLPSLSDLLLKRPLSHSLGSPFCRIIDQFLIRRRRLCGKSLV